MMQRKIDLILFSLLWFERCFACREKFISETTHAWDRHYDYDYNINPTIVYSTIVCSNIYSIGEIYYSYEDTDYDQFLKVTDSNVTTLQANKLSQFTTIRKLYLSGIHIKTILPGAFTGLSRLEELNLNDNELTEISEGVFADLQQLKILDLSKNYIFRIEKFALQGVPSLQKLYLQDNNISNIEDNVFHKLVHLNFLDLSGNPVDKVNVDGLSNLEYLNLFRTSMTDLNNLSFTNITSMRVLNLTSSRVRKLDCSKLPHIDEIYLGKNNITSMDNCHNISAHNLYLGYNRMQRLNGGSKILEGLYWSRNQLESIDTISLSGYSSISNLDLGFNNISKIEVGVFRILPRLCELHLNSNNISFLDVSVFDGLTELTFLNLSHNSISKLRYGTFNNLKSLQQLDISYNKIVELHPSMLYLPKLNQLHFDHNNISSFEVEDLANHLPSLSLISLSGNPWKCKQLVQMIYLLHNIAVIRNGENYDEENFMGVACKNDNLENENLLEDLEKLRKDQFTNEVLKNSIIAKLSHKTFENSSSEINGSHVKPKTSVLNTSQVHISDSNTGFLVMNVLQAVLCLSLIFLVYFMYRFLKNNSLTTQSVRYSQLELCRDDCNLF